MSAAAARGDARLVTFAVGGGAFALPIGAVVEVSEVGRVACVPLLPLGVAGVVNHHGDALPVIAPEALLELGEEALPHPEHALVIADRARTAACLALPVDRVLGLTEHRPEAARGGELAAERTVIDGRLTTLLDPRVLVERAAEVIERAAGRADAGRGGTG